MEQSAKKIEASNDELAFFDKAENYTFSDWLIPYAVGVGVDDLNEYYLGGFPDLSSFLKRGEKDFSIDIQVFQNLIDSKLTRFGKLLQRQMANKTFVDLGCGLPERSVVPRLFAQVFGAKEYMGVDHLNVTNESKLAFEKLDFRNAALRATFVRSDILSFLSDRMRKYPAVYFMAGIEPQRKSGGAITSGDLYLERVARELDRLFGEGDLLILGAGTPDLLLDRNRFKSIYCDQYHEVFALKQPSFLQKIRDYFFG